MPDKNSGITQTEAKTVVALSCSFFTSDVQLAKIMQMLYGVERVADLTSLPYDDYAGTGFKLARLSEKFFNLRQEELDRLILEECECVNCGHREFYLTTEWDAPKRCAKCEEMSTFLTAVPEEKMVEP